MRVATCLFALVVSLSPIALLATPAAAQQPTTPIACDGDVNIVRVSDIKPGMMQKFLDAVAAQQAWYKNAGTPDKIYLMRIYDQESHSVSTTQVMTSHVHPGNAPQGPPRDAAFAAFVTLFRDSSTIKSEYFTCVAK